MQPLSESYESNVSLQFYRLDSDVIVCISYHGICGNTGVAHVFCMLVGRRKSDRNAQFLIDYGALIGR